MSGKAPRVQDMDPVEMQRSEVTMAICVEIGVRQSFDTPLTKKSLNALYRYLTGEYHFPPGFVNTGLSPTHEEVRSSIVARLDELGYELGPSPVDTERPFLLPELRTIADALRSEPNRTPRP